MMFLEKLGGRNKRENKIMQKSQINNVFSLLPKSIQYNGTAIGDEVCT